MSGEAATEGIPAYTDDPGSFASNGETCACNAGVTVDTKQGVPNAEPGGNIASDSSTELRRDKSMVGSSHGRVIAAFGGEPCFIGSGHSDDSVDSYRRRRRDAVVGVGMFAGQASSLSALFHIRKNLEKDFAWYIGDCPGLNAAVRNLVREDKTEYKH